LKEALRKVRGTSDDGSVIEKAYLLSKEEKSMMVVGARKHTKEEKKQRAKNNDELEKGTKCNRCHKVGHWERECLDDDVLQD
jgi:hypothetical protein